MKELLRLHYSKNTKLPYLTSFPVICTLEKMHISNKHSKFGAQVVTKRQGNLVSKIELRASWSIFDASIINTEYKISFRTIMSHVMWEDVGSKMR